MERLAAENGHPAVALGGERGDLLLLSGFWSFAFLLSSVRGEVGGEIPFELIAPHRFAVMLFGAGLCWVMIRVIETLGERRFAERALIGLAGAALMTMIQSAFHWLSCRVAPIDGYAPISVPETLTSGMMALVYFLAWTWMHLALVYHREMEAERLRTADVPQPPGRAAEQTVPVDSFWVSRRKQLVRVPAKDIVWIEAQKDYVSLHTASLGGMLRETMAAVEARLDPELFVRVHRSAIVRRSEVAAIRRKPSGALAMTLRSGDEVPVGRSYAKGLRALAQQLRDR